VPKIFRNGRNLEHPGRKHTSLDRASVKKARRLRDYLLCAVMAALEQLEQPTQEQDPPGTRIVVPAPSREDIRWLPALLCSTNELVTSFMLQSPFVF
jgi:hypothetical protein